MQVGTPPQIMSLLPALYVCFGRPNDPTIPGTDLFDTSLHNISGPVGYDSISFGINTSLNGFPLRITSKGIDLSTNQVQISLGPTSTLLTVLEQTGHIISRIWS